MTADQERYRRGWTAALVGLGIQIALVLAMGLTALWTESPAIHAAAWHVLGGIPIWIVLALAYQQFEAERRETLAAEKLSHRDAASAVLFGELSDELQRARQRLANLLGYGLPGVSFLVAGYLVAAGLASAWRFWSISRNDAPGVVTTIAPGVSPVGLLFVAGAMAFVAFIAARWVSGYTRVRDWQLLRGGASYLMSCFVVAALLLAGAVGAAVLDDASLFRVIAAAVPAVMVLVGAEMLLTAMLAAYRPKRPGEIPRPAFDSRVLGLLTAPESLGQVVAELINYQFGVEVSRSWLYRLLGRAVTPLTLFGAAVLAALSTLVVVGPDEQGIVTRFGAVRGAALPPGLHLKWPWPVEAAASYPVGRVLEVTVSSDLAERPADEAAILWTGGDDNLAKLAMEYYPTSLGRGGGMGLVAADVVVQFRVRDLLEFLSGSLAPKDAVAVIAHQEAGRYFATHDLDHLLTAGRTEGGAELERTIQERSDVLGLGLDIVGVSITSLKPPGGRVARAFHRQIGAQQERETLIQKGHRDAVVTLAKVAGSVDHAARINDAILELDAYRSGGEDEANLRRIAGKELDIEALLGEARGEAAELVHAARGYRWTRSVGERSAQERFAGELLAYERAPAYYRMKRFFDVLATGMADRRKFVIAGEAGDRPVLRMDFNDSATAIDTLLGK